MGAAIVICVVGCGGPSGPEQGALSGRVLLDGKPLEGGSINFFPTGNTRGAATGTNIVDGYYELSSSCGPVVGKNRVEITSAKKTGRQAPDVRNPGATIEEKVPLVPACYNKDSTLTVEIQSGQNRQDFALKSL